MSDREELLEAALEGFPEGIVLLSAGGEVRLWNRAAEAITGYKGADLVGRPLPEGLNGLACKGTRCVEAHGDACRGTLVHARHKLGQGIGAITRVLALRDGLGERIGAAAVFHPADSLDALPHGEAGEDELVTASQEELEERLKSEFEDFMRGGMPFGVLWIGVDQAHDLLRTHGAVASEAMLKRVERSMKQGMRPADELGRWGSGEFLVIAHERTAKMLSAHGTDLAGLARTADFRWWGDLISITVSVGAAQAEAGREETLGQLLERAREAMAASADAGGNRVTPMPGSGTCLPL
jgi:diguanylate cyclase (GGDEF)-like protein/PAS domain S-box-containing protein